MEYCDKCGVCCKLFKLINFSGEFEFLKEYDDGTGKCKYLKNNLCSIYDNRPLFCNSKLLYEEKYKFKMSEQEYYKFLKKECNILKNIYKNYCKEKK